jgi:hypothetical protein
MSAPDAGEQQSAAPADIKVSARGDRRALETLYLELRELAARNGLKIEYRLSVGKPDGEKGV